MAKFITVANTGRFKDNSDMFIIYDLGFIEAKRQKGKERN